MTKQEFSKALSNAFSGAVVGYNDLWNFSVDKNTEKSQWLFVLQADYIRKIESNENVDNDIERLSKLPPEHYLLCIDPSLPLNSPMVDDLLIVPVPSKNSN